MSRERSRRILEQARAGMTQSDLAAKYGVSRTRIQHLIKQAEKHEQPAESFRRAKALQTAAVVLRAYAESIATLPEPPK